MLGDFSVIRATLVRLSLHQWLCVWLHHKIRVAARLPSRASLERFAEVGIENASQQAFKCMVIDKQNHSLSVKFSINWRSSTFFLGLGTNSLRTPVGVSSLTVRVGSSLQVMKYCAFSSLHLFFQFIESQFGEAA